MPGRDPILIVGGGLGGLTTALALCRRGIAARVLEGASAFGAIGYGIQFGPNVCRAFDRLGLLDAVLAVCAAPEAVLMRDALTGAELVRVPTGAPLRRRFGYPYITAHRVDIHNVLLDACRRSADIELVPDAMVCGFEAAGERVAVTTADGRSFSGPALVAADGVRSLFRQALVGDGEPRPIGYAALRTIVPIAAIEVDVPRDSVLLWSGPGYHVIHYPLRHGTEFNIVVVYRTASHADRAAVSTSRAELDAICGDAHATVRALAAMTDFRWRRSVTDRDPVRHWHRGRIAMLGDAAHAPLQSLAQGAGMAIEDGLCLAALIDAADGAFESAFRRFEALRVTRTARVQLESRAIWDWLIHPGGIARDVRTATVADWDAAHLFDCLAWLYDGPVLPDEATRQHTV